LTTAIFPGQAHAARGCGGDAGYDALDGMPSTLSAVGWLSTNIFGEDNSRDAMASVPDIFGLGPFALIARTARLFHAPTARVGADAE